jgi:hypothetical protein
LAVKRCQRQQNKKGLLGDNKCHQLTNYFTDAATNKNKKWVGNVLVVAVYRESVVQVHGSGASTETSPPKETDAK